MQVLSPLSTEFIRIPVSANGYTITQIKACAVAVAVVPYSGEPSTGDWNAAIWSEGDVAYALLMVGPGANLTLSAKTSYDIWVRITTPAPQSFIAIVRAGTIRTSGVAGTGVPGVQYDLRAKVINLAATLGDDFTVPFVVNENGLPYEWAGAVVEGQIRPTEASATVLTTFAFDTSVDGHLIASLTDAQTTALGQSANYYSIRSTKNSITRTWVKGQLVISPAATQ